MLHINKEDYASIANFFISNCYGVLGYGYVMSRSKSKSIMPSKQGQS